MTNEAIFPYASIASPEELKALSEILKVWDVLGTGTGTNELPVALNENLIAADLGAVRTPAHMLEQRVRSTWSAAVHTA